MQTDHRQYTDEEKQRLTANLLSVTKEVHAGEWSDRPLAITTLTDLHRRVFQGVRDHAGKHRCRGWGSEFLNFGPNRSARSHDVEANLEAAFQRAKTSIRSLSENQGDPHYEESALYVAVWLHAEIVRIHPFEDGNGRSSRLTMSMVLVMLGMEPIPAEAVKDEYCKCLNEFFRSDNIRPLRDLFLRLA